MADSDNTLSDVTFEETFVERIKELYDVIIESLEIVDISDDIVSFGVLTSEDIAYAQAQQTEEERNKVFIDTILSRGEDACNTFMDVLRYTGKYYHIVNNASDDDDEESVGDFDNVQPGLGELPIDAMRREIMEEMVNGETADVGSLPGNTWKTCKKKIQTLSSHIEEILPLRTFMEKMKNFGLISDDDRTFIESRGRTRCKSTFLEMICSRSEAICSEFIDMFWRKGLYDDLFVGQDQPVQENDTSHTVTRDDQASELNVVKVKDHSEKISAYLDYPDILEEMISIGALSPEIRTLIALQSTKYDKNEAFLKAVLEHGDHTCEAFLNVLRRYSEYEIIFTEIDLAPAASDDISVHLEDARKDLILDKPVVEKIQELSDVIIESLKIVDIEDDLNFFGVLTSEDMALIQAQQTDEKKNRILLEAILSRGHESCEAFLDVLEECESYRHIVDECRPKRSIDLTGSTTESFGTNDMVNIPDRCQESQHKPKEKNKVYGTLLKHGIELAVDSNRFKGMLEDMVLYGALSVDDCTAIENLPFADRPTFLFEILRHRGDNACAVFIDSLREDDTIVCQKGKTNKEPDDSSECSSVRSFIDFEMEYGIKPNYEARFMEKSQIIINSLYLPDILYKMVIETGIPTEEDLTLIESESTLADQNKLFLEVIIKEKQCGQCYKILLMDGRYYNLVKYICHNMPGHDEYGYYNGEYKNMRSGCPFEKNQKIMLSTATPILVPPPPPPDNPPNPQI